VPDAIDQTLLDAIYSLDEVRSLSLSRALSLSLSHALSHLLSLSLSLSRALSLSLSLPLSLSHTHDQKLLDATYSLDEVFSSSFLLTSNLSKSDRRSVAVD